MNFRRTALALLSLGLFLFSPIPTIAAENAGETGQDSYQGEVLCSTQNQLMLSEDCLKLGPAGYLARMDQLGVSFPLRPLPALAPDPSLTQVDVRYGEVVHRNAPVFASLEDAIKKGVVIRRVESPFSFISYTDDAVVDSKRYYMLRDGGWMTANDISRIGTPSLFQGLTFTRSPERSFGWVLFPVNTKRSPGFLVDDYTGNELNRYEKVQIYAHEIIDGTEWFMVAPDEWIPEKQDYQRFIGRVFADSKPPEGVGNGRWIEVNLHDQTVSVFDHGTLVFASLVASGIEPFWTRPGLFKIYQKLNSTLMQGSFEADRSDAYYLEDVPWTMYFDKARALHGTYWHNGFGAPRSHGCVNLSVGDARWIFDWAQEGDWVYVWDPSGETPTDPSFYGEGGA